MGGQASHQAAPPCLQDSLALHVKSNKGRWVFKIYLPGSVQGRPQHTRRGLGTPQVRARWGGLTFSNPVATAKLKKGREEGGTIMYDMLKNLGLSKSNIRPIEEF